MKLHEIFEGVDEASRGIFGRTGPATLKRKFRCTSGPRKGRIVSDPATCNKPIDVAKRIRAKQTRKKKPGLAAFKRAKTMRTTPVTKILKKVNPLRKTAGRKIKGIGSSGIKRSKGIKR
mgnify:FL=1|tara:strand:- start:196 stop:552 length:357 start_codon:yes stop_codon:yes gene_type:complete